MSEGFTRTILKSLILGYIAYLAAWALSGDADWAGALGFGVYFGYFARATRPAGKGRPE